MSNTIDVSPPDNCSLKCAFAVSKDCVVVGCAAPAASKAWEACCSLAQLIMSPDVASGNCSQCAAISALSVFVSGCVSTMPLAMLPAKADDSVAPSTTEMMRKRALSVSLNLCSRASVYPFAGPLLSLSKLTLMIRAMDALPLPQSRPLAWLVQVSAAGAGWPTKRQYADGTCMHQIACMKPNLFSSHWRRA